MLLIELKIGWNADVSHMGGCGYSPNTTHMTRDTSLNGSTAWPVASMADMVCPPSLAPLSSSTSITLALLLKYFNMCVCMCVY